MFDPRLIFAGLWLFQILGHLILREEFPPFSWLTWTIITSAVTAFLVGGQIGSRLPIPHWPRAPSRAVREPLVRWFALASIILYLIGCIVAGIALYNILSRIDSVTGYAKVYGGVITLAGIRSMVHMDFIGERDIFNILRIFYFGIGLCVFLLTFARSFSRKEITAIIVVGLASAFATTGRLYLLLFVVAAAALLYRQRLITAKSVVQAGLGFCVLFVIFALLLAKGVGAGSMFQQIIWNLKTYTLSSLACFNNFVNTGFPEIQGGALLPNAVRTILGQVGIAIAAKPVLMPWANVPDLCNTYTALFPFYHDGRAIGVIAGLFLLGILHQYLYKLHSRSESPIVWYVFALSLYPLVMSIFEDAYFSSPGLWLLLWIPPLMYWSFQYAWQNWHGGTACG